MSIPAREKAMSDFRESEDLRIMIASLKAGGIGLDLTMANKCILIDPWWNEAVQQQVSKNTVPNLTISIYANTYLFRIPLGVLPTIPHRTGERSGGCETRREREYRRIYDRSPE